MTRTKIVDHTLKCFLRVVTAVNGNENETLRHRGHFVSTVTRRATENYCNNRKLHCQRHYDDISTDQSAQRLFINLINDVTDVPQQRTTGCATG